MKPLIVVWFSCGAASAVAAKFTLDKYSDTHDIMIVNQPVDEEHPDNIRFLNDVSRWLGKEIIKFSNPMYNTTSAVDIWNDRQYMSGVKGAPCTMILKKQARYAFEKCHNIAFHVLGFTSDEIHRHNNFIKSERDNLLPVLIDAGLTKNDCFDILLNAGIDLPVMYKLGFPNNNCIGCSKATSASYWNLVRLHFPLVFEQRAKQSYLIGCKLTYYKGKRIFLHELPLDAKGHKMKSWECGIFCQSSHPKSTR